MKVGTHNFVEIDKKLLPVEIVSPLDTYYKCENCGLIIHRARKGTLLEGTIFISAANKFKKEMRPSDVTCNEVIIMGIIE